MEAHVLQFPLFTDEEDDEHSPHPLGAELAASLPADLGALCEDDLLEAAAAARRLASWAQARELAAIAELHQRRTQAEQAGDPDYRIVDAHESVCQEVSAALSVTGQAAGTLVDLADRLATTLPGTQHALQGGRIDLNRARVVCELTHRLEPGLCELIEALVLPTADRRTTGQLRRRIRDLLRRLAPERLQQRKREAVRDRRLEVWDDEHTGTSNLVLSGLDPVWAHGIANRITAAARTVKADGGPRTLQQIRADLAQHLLHGRDLPDAIHRVADQAPDQAPVQVQAGPAVVIEPTGRPPAVLGDAGAGDAIAGLVAEMADRHLREIRDRLRVTGGTRALAFQITRAAQDIHDRLTGLRETWCRNHDPAHGRTLHQPTATLRRAIEARHLTCTFPTCNQRSKRCDLDHTIPWGAGKTCQCNLAPLCRRHHRLKQTPGWKLLQLWPGMLLWITPAGNWHITLPTRQ